MDQGPLPLGICSTHLLGHRVVRPGFAKLMGSIGSTQGTSIIGFFHDVVALGTHLACVFYMECCIAKM